MNIKCRTSDILAKLWQSLERCREENLETVELLSNLSDVQQLTINGCIRWTTLVQF